MTLSPGTTPSSLERPPVTALYVPGTRPDRFDKAAASGADVVILDLEDSVAASDKDRARANVVRWLAGEPDPAVDRLAAAGVRLQVRVNATSTPWAADDLAALPGGIDIRLPKLETTADLDVAGAHRVHAIIESALGVEHAYQIAAHPSVATLTPGEADLAADLGATGETAMAWVRTRLVVAARAAGLPAPMMSAYPGHP